MIQQSRLNTHVHDFSRTTRRSVQRNKLHTFDGADLNRA